LELKYINYDAELIVDFITY